MLDRFGKSLCIRDGRTADDLHNGPPIPDLGSIPYPPKQQHDLKILLNLCDGMLYQVLDVRLTVEWMYELSTVPGQHGKRKEKDRKGGAAGQCTVSARVITPPVPAHNPRFAPVLV